MAEVIEGRLGALDGITTASILYRVPAGRKAVLSSVNVCNRAATLTRVSISHVTTSVVASLVTADYIVYNEKMYEYDSEGFKRGITMAASDMIVADSDNASVTFIVWGVEHR